MLSERDAEDTTEFDTSVHVLERKLGRTRDERDRLALTQAYLRERVGRVVVWPWRPLGQRTIRVILRRQAPIAQHAYCLAVLDLDDLTEVTAVCGLQGARVVDVAKLGPVDPNVRKVDMGEWRASESIHSPFDFDLDPETRRTLIVARALAGEVRLGPVVGLGRHGCLFDSEWADTTKNTHYVNLFQNFQNFCHAPDGAVPKQYGVDVNMGGMSGCMPQGHAMVVTGLSVMVSHAIPDSDLEALGRCGFRFLIAQTALVDLPMRQLLDREPFPRQAERHFLNLEPPGVLPLAEPVLLMPLENFQHSMTLPEDATLSRPTKIKSVMHGRIVRLHCG